MPLYKEAPAPPRGPEPVFGPPPPAKIAIDESQDKLPQPLRMLTRLLEHAIITPVFDSLFGVSGIRETAPQPLCTQLQAQVVHSFSSQQADATAIAASPDGVWIFVANAAGSIDIINGLRGQVVTTWDPKLGALNVLKFLPGSAPASLPQPTHSHPPPVPSSLSSSISFDCLLLAGEKGITLAVLDVDAAELKPLATFAHAGVIAADVCPEFGVVAAMTADTLLLLKAPPMPLAPSLSSEADQAVAVTCTDMKIIAKHACAPQPPTSSSSSPPSPSCCLLRAPFLIKSCQPPRSLPVPHACLVWTPGSRSITLAALQAKQDLQEFSSSSVQRQQLPTAITALAVFRTHTLAAIAAPDGLLLWDLRLGCSLHQAKIGPAPLTAVAFCGDDTIAVGSSKGSVYIFHMKDFMSTPSAGVMPPGAVLHSLTASAHAITCLSATDVVPAIIISDALNFSFIVPLLSSSPSSPSPSPSPSPFSSSEASALPAALDAAVCSAVSVGEFIVASARPKVFAWRLLDATAAIYPALLPLCKAANPKNTCISLWHATAQPQRIDTSFLRASAVAAHAAEDDSKSHGSSAASNSVPHPSQKSRASASAAAARLPSSAGGLGLGQLESRRPSVKSHLNSHQEELSAKNVADHERASALRTSVGGSCGAEFFDVADVIHSCTVLTQQQRTALKQRIKKSQAAAKP